MTRIADELAALRGWRSNALALAAGAATALAMAPVHIWPLCFLTLPLLVVLLDGASSGHRRLRRAAVIGWLFGFGYFLAGLYWIGFAFFIEPEKFAWAMPFAVAGVPAGLAVFYAVACTLAMTLWRSGSSRIIALAGSFFALEWLRGHIFTGFPWNLLGYSLTANDSLLQSAAIFGVYPLTFLAVLIFASPAAVLARAGVGSRSRASWLLPGLAVFCLAAMWTWGELRMRAATGEAVAGVQLRIVQANIPQQDKWRPEKREWIFERYLALSRGDQPAGVTGRPGPTHIIWPESSVPFLFMADGRIFDTSAKAAIAGIAPPAGGVILGAERAETRLGEDGKRYVDKIFNSLFVLDGRGEVQSLYDKVHLVPFGEYLPFPDFFKWLGFKHLTHHAIGFHAGSERPALSGLGLPAFSPLICYEIIFPGNAVPNNGRVGWLLNITNDAWFGPTSGPYQHLQQVRIRAVEEGLPVVRAANTGVSAVIDAYGRVRQSLPLETAGVIDADLPAALEPTFLAQNRKFPLLFVAIFAILGYLTLLKVDSNHSC